MELQKIIIFLSNRVEWCDLFPFSKHEKSFIFVTLPEERAQGDRIMKLTDELTMMKEENQKLKEDNEMLLNILTQMKVTLNRLVNRYIAEQPEL